jgi:quercetin dioxygenase-like cupin family protein
MARVIAPPGARNQRHYHIYCDAGMHIIKGRLRIFIGPDHDMEETIAEAGDFIFVPAGIIRGFMNLSDTEDVELVTSGR